MIDILNNLLFLLISLAAFKITGHIILYCLYSPDHLKNTKFLTLFCELSTGFCAWIVCCSLIKTSFETVNIFFLVVPLYLILFSKSRQKLFSLKRIAQLNIKQIFSGTLTLFALVIPVFLVQVSLNFDMYGNLLNPHLDTYYYAKQAFINNTTGIEGGNNINLIFPEYGNRHIPYHYFELWFIGFISSFFRNSPMFSFLLVVIPVFGVALFTGLLCILEHYKRLKYYDFIFIFTLLFVGCIHLPGFDSEKLNYMNLNLLNTSLFSHFTKKMIVVSFFSLCFLIAYIKNHTRFAIIIFACLPMANVALLPAAAGGLCLFVFVTWLRHILFHKGSFEYKFVLFLIVWYLSFAAFYSPDLGYIVDKFSNSVDKPETKIVTLKSALSQTTGFHIYWIKRKLLLPLIKCVFFYSPYIFIIILFFKRSYKNKKQVLSPLFMLFSTCIFSGLAMYGFLIRPQAADGDFFGAFHSAEAIQFFSHTLPMINMLIAFLLILTWDTLLKNYQKNFISRLRILIVLLIYTFCMVLQIKGVLPETRTLTANNYYSEEYLQKTSEIISQYDHDIILTTVWHRKTQDFGPFTNKYAITSTHIAALGYVCEVNLIDSIFIFRHRFHTFGKFIELEKKKGVFKSLNQSRLNFIRKYDVKIHIQHPDEIFFIPEEMVEQRITDKKTGEIFIVFKTG
ncbi:MAG: hypothetical protein HQK83_15395 [Fibrobacteria bacterium]|nr:hypothetical protein [Fibrobacteria bacterium]